MDEIKGSRLTIKQAEDGYIANLTAVLGMVARNAQQLDNFKARLLARLRQLANSGQLRSPDHWNTEGVLPNGKHYYAVKLKRLRAYGWHSSKVKGVFFVSHYAFKHDEKLDPVDDARVIANWRRIEE